MDKAIFLDRDGIINEFVYYHDIDTIDAPRGASQVKLVHGISQLIKAVREMGFKTIIASNQPGMALGKLTRESFEGITQRIKNLLGEEGAILDNEYYCTHHPFGIHESLAIQCDCRKPGIGMFKKAEDELGIDLKKSWFIGDGLTDVKAGFTAGCKTILRGFPDQTGFLALVEKELGDIKPDYIIRKLPEAIEIIRSYE